MTSSSPAPRATASQAQATASASRSVLPPCVTTRPPRASIAQTTACAPNSAASPVSSVGIVERCSVHGDLVGPGAEQRAGVLETGDPAADRERNRQPLRRTLHELEHRPAPVDGRGDVQEDELVGADVGVPLCELDRIADVAQRLEAHTLDDAATGDVEAGDQALLDHCSTFSSTRAPAAPLRSGWNWTPASTPSSIAATTAPAWSTRATTRFSSSGCTA